MKLTNKKIKKYIFLAIISAISLLYALYMGYEYIQYKKWQERKLLQEQSENQNRELTQEEKLKKILDSLDPTKELENIKIDEYNFQQLEKAKVILENIAKDTKNFFGLKEFNSIYKASIEPIKNCYFVGSKNGKEKYIFGFKLESKKYIMQYKTEYYAYPKYDIPVDEICTGHCYDFNRPYFEYLISHPCENNN